MGGHVIMEWFKTSMRRSMQSREGCGWLQRTYQLELFIIVCKGTLYSLWYSSCDVIMASFLSFVTRAPLTSVRPFQSSAGKLLRSQVLQSRYPSPLIARAMATKIQGEAQMG